MTPIVLLACLRIPVQGRLRGLFLAAGYVHPVSPCSAIGCDSSTASELSIGAVRCNCQLCWVSGASTSHYVPSHR